MPKRAGCAFRGKAATDSGLSRDLCGPFRSCRDENALAQQRKACTTIGGSLDCLQPGDLPFNGTAAPRRADRRGDGVGVTLKTADETVQRAAPRLAHPCLQRRPGLGKIRATLTQQRGKGICQITGADHSRGEVSEMAKKAPLLRLELIWRYTQQAGAEPRRGHRPCHRPSFDVRSTGVFLTAPRCPAHDTALAAAVALGAEFTPEPRAIATAFGPAVGEESFKRRDVA